MITDDNECARPGVCGQGVCQNTLGSFDCSCPPGQTMDANTRYCLCKSPISHIYICMPVTCSTAFDRHLHAITPLLIMYAGTLYISIIQVFAGLLPREFYPTPICLPYVHTPAESSNACSVLHHSLEIAENAIPVMPPCT